MTVKRAHIIVEGRVQGVYYRQSMKQMADYFGAKGWVRNLPGGEVEAVIEGDESAVGNLLGWSRQGPSAAVVESVSVDWQEPKGEFKDFSVKR